MKHLVVAVSGGIDSVVMLDKLVREGSHEIVVAHFDHGIRPESDADARFVHGLAEKYNVLFEAKREELGPSASEDMARTSRHAFLREVAKKYDGAIATAHHQDDVIETIAINIHRGTGWRGLAVFGNEAIKRPLIDMTKKDIRDYASEHRLEWVEDETNASDVYLRNRLRSQINRTISKTVKAQLITLWQDQLIKRRDIEAEAAHILKKDTHHTRHFFTQIDEQSGQELLWTLLNQSNVSLMASQRRRLLHGIKTAKPGSVFEAGSGVIVRFSTRSFIVETP